MTDTSAPKSGDAPTFLDSLHAAGGESLAQGRARRTAHEAFPLDRVVVVPEENYRWGSKESMEADLGRLDEVMDNGELRASYTLLRDSIRVLGVEDPIGIVERDDGFHVIFGFTRAVAAKECGLAAVPAFVYDSTISDDEVEALQMRENSRPLKREVNWVNEVEMFDSLLARLLNRNPEVLQAQAALSAARKAAAAVANPEKREAAEKAAATAFRKVHGGQKAAAERTVCTILGRNAQVMRSRHHYLRHLDKRVIAIAREGRMSCTTAQLFMSGDVANPFPDEFIGEVLAVLAETAKKNGCPHEKVTTEQVRQAMRVIRVRGADVEHVGSTKARQSPSILRDVSVCLACRLLTARRLSLASPAATVEELRQSFEWAQVSGLGMGAGDISMPPVSAVELTSAMKKDKSKAFSTDGEELSDDEAMQRMEAQHERGSERYCLTVFISAFLRNALSNAGVRNFDRDADGWFLKSTVVPAAKPGADDRHVHHRMLFYDAVRAGLALPQGTLLARAQAAWEKVRPYAPRAAAPAATGKQRPAA